MPQRLELLGTPRLIDTATGEALLSGVPAAILAFLHVVDRPVSRKDLATLFWPGKSERSSRHGLRQALHRIRAATGDETLDGTDPLQLESPWFESDYDAFASAIVARDLPAALDLWRGPFLSDFSRPGAWELEEWIDTERDRLDGMLSDAVVAMASAESGELSVRERLPLVHAARTHLPWNQRVQAAQARLLIELGRVEEALALIPGPDDRSPSVEWADLEVLAESNGESPASARLPKPDPEDEPKLQAGPDPDSSPRSWSQSRAALVAMISLFVLVFVVTEIAAWSRTDGAPGEAALPPADAWTVFFCSDRATGVPGRYQLFRMAADGSEKHRIFAADGCQVHWMPELGAIFMGLAATPGGELSLHLLRPSLENPVAEWDARAIPGGAGLRSIRFARERTGLVQGTRAAFAAEDADGNRDIYLFDALADTIVPIASHPAEDWDPWVDGDRVLFTSRRTGNGDIYAWSITDGSLEQLTDHPLEEAAPRSWGDSIFLTRGSGVGDEDGNLEIVLIDESGAEQPLTTNGWNDHVFALSPNGRYLCWTSEEKGHYESDVVVLDLQEGRRWTEVDAPGRDGYCLWTADSSGFLFNTWRDGQLEVYWTPLDGEETNLSRYPSNDDVMGVVPGRLGEGAND